MQNLDYLPPEIGLPLAAILWLLLLGLILWDRRKLNIALRNRPAIKIRKDGKWVDISDEDPQRTKLKLLEYTGAKHKPSNNFYDQEKDNAG